jgi:hypothetical protein
MDLVDVNNNISTTRSNRAEKSRRLVIRTLEAPFDCDLYLHLTTSSSLPSTPSAPQDNRS